MLDKRLSSQSHRYNYVGVIANSFEVTRVGKFMKMNPPTFIDSKVNKDPREFIYEMEKILRVIHAINLKGVKFSTY